MPRLEEGPVCQYDSSVKGHKALRSVKDWKCRLCKKLS